jgi:hypothetical protein
MLYDTGEFTSTPTGNSSIVLLIPDRQTDFLLSRAINHPILPTTEEFTKKQNLRQ